MFKGVLPGAAREVGRVMRAVTPAHANLRARLVLVTVVTIVLEALSSVAIYMFERGAHGTEIRTLGDALFWTSSQFSTVSSSIANPLTTGGRILGVVIDFYAITVVATLAASFGAFFHHKRMQDVGATVDPGGTAGTERPAG
jgi:hypothetical protein